MSGMAKEKTPYHRLREVIRVERLRRDLAAYGAITVTDDEVALARTTPSWADLADDTDWNSLYADANAG